MYISKVEISKYKGFNEATIELVDGLNVILGHNNGGKSTLLDAIALVIDTERKKKLSAWDFYQGISLAELKENAPSIKISLYFPCQVMKVTIQAMWHYFQLTQFLLNLNWRHV